jgi:surfeit locus 1 family protein
LLSFVIMASSSGSNSSRRSAVVGLNLPGKVFFGGLCAGTLYLGVWQTRRYFEKIALIEQRRRELTEEPVPLTTATATSMHTGFRKRLVEGRFRHENEMLVGLRGPPPGALAVSGPASGRSEGGMSSGPQVRDLY